VKVDLKIGDMHDANMATKGNTTWSLNAPPKYSKF